MSKMSPCENCTRTANPGMCEDKTCVRWRRWYLQRWDLIHSYYEKIRKDGQL